DGRRSGFSSRGPWNLWNCGGSAFVLGGEGSAPSQFFSVCPHLFLFLRLGRGTRRGIFSGKGFPKNRHRRDRGLSGHHDISSLSVGLCRRRFHCLPSLRHHETLSHPLAGETFERRVGGRS